MAFHSSLLLPAPWLQLCTSTGRVKPFILTRGRHSIKTLVTPALGRCRKGDGWPQGRTDAASYALSLPQRRIVPSKSLLALQLVTKARLGISTLWYCYVCGMRYTEHLGKVGPGKCVSCTHYYHHRITPTLVFAHHLNLKYSEQTITTMRCKCLVQYSPYGSLYQIA